MRTSFTLAASLAVLGTVSANAADITGTIPTRCAITAQEQTDRGIFCVMPIARPQAQLDQITGNVLKAQTVGYSPIQMTPDQLAIGDKVLFGADGQAVFRAANCVNLLGPNATLVVGQLDANCAYAALINNERVSPLHAALFAGAVALIAIELLKPPPQISP